MGYAEYFALLLSDPQLYVAALLIASLIYYLFLRNQVESVFDPLFLNMAFAAVGAATVLFLRFTGNVETKVFIQYCLSELLFLAFLVSSPLRLGKISCDDRPLHVDSSRRLLQCIYIISALMFLVSQAVVYIQNGLPILYDDRLDYYAGGSGLGILSRAISVSSYFCWYLLIYKYVYRWKIKYLPGAFDALLALCLIASSVLNGSKSGLLIVIYMVFFFRILHRGASSYRISADRALGRIQKLTLGIAFVVALAVLIVTGFSSSLVESFGPLLTRVLSSGDVYFMAYPGAALHDLDASHPFNAIFGSTLWMLRLIDKSSMVEPIGIQLYHNVIQLPFDRGPNARHNVFGLVYFGFWVSLLYSSILGYLVAVVRNVTIKYVRLGGLSELIYVFAVMQIINVNTDVELVISAFDSFAIVASIIFAAAFILNVATKDVMLGDHVAVAFGSD